VRTSTQSGGGRDEACTIFVNYDTISLPLR
jgi:hypothetical protein